MSLTKPLCARCLLVVHADASNPVCSEEGGGGHALGGGGSSSEEQGGGGGARLCEELERGVASTVGEEGGGRAASRSQGARGEGGGGGGDQAVAGCLDSHIWVWDLDTLRVVRRSY